jgi:pimeloyl-ACP methyl ester carboxylesterase
VSTEEERIMKGNGIVAASGVTRRGLFRSWRRLLIVLAMAASVLVVGSFGISGYIGWRLTHPSRVYATQTPATAGLAYSNVLFSSREGGVQLSGWFMPAGHSARTVIFAHGYAEYRLQEVPSLPVARVLVQHGFNVLAFDFRGCGKSGGDMVTLGQDEPSDVLGAIDFLKARAPGQRVQIGILGFSLGATTALEAAGKDQADIRAVVSDSAFADLYSYVVDHADHWTHLPAIPFNQETAWVTPILTGMDPGKVNALYAVKLLPNTPMFFIAGTADTTIPAAANTVRLYTIAATHQKQLWLVPGGGHTDSYKQQPRVYEQRVLDFFSRYLPAQG